jgi:F-type H+-transporting ATPase subunit b
MEETLRQLGELLLGSIPTIILFLVLFVSYRSLVHVPLTKVLAERRTRTEGALQKARADMAAAEARTAEYEQRVREARASVFKTQEARRQQALQARAARLAQARSSMDEKVKQAKAALAEEIAQSKATLQVEAERLASDIIGGILRQVAAVRRPAGGGQ